MKKLLHERLREWADSTEGDKYPSTKMIYATIESDHAPLGADDERKAFHLLADEIEKYYIPRPRFDDGEPVHFDDRFYSGYTHAIETVSSMKFTPGGFKLNGGLRYDYGEPVRRCLPEPKVLDADGVEIKVGDTVWGKYSGVEHEVIGFDSCDGLLCVSIRNVETGSTGGSSPNLLTHREPDSLEKLLVDLRGAADFIPSKEYLKHLADRLTAIMERDA